VQGRGLVQRRVPVGDRAVRQDWCQDAPRREVTLCCELGTALVHIAIYERGKKNSLQSYFVEKYSDNHGNKKF
jgi:hypothetical protein